MSGKYLIGNMLSAMYNKKCFYEDPIVAVYSNVCVGILKKMQANGYIEKFNIIEENNKKNINIYLRTVNGNKTINSFKLISKPGCRIYNTVEDLKKKVSFNPYSLVLISTSKGVMTSYEAIENKIGGEVLCEIF